MIVATVASLIRMRRESRSMPAARGDERAQEITADKD